jgi:penicillin amidase
MPYPRIDLDDAQLEKLFTVIPVAIIVLAGLASLWIYFSVAALLPEAQTVVNLPELNSKVTVVRERNGVPTIIAESQEDLAIVFGYVTAQDRLWQMDYLRRLGQGSLAEILGRDYLVTDQIMRAIGQSRESQDELSHLDHAETVWLEKFIHGINSFMLLHKDRTPVEFSLLDYQPAPFSKEDITGIMRALAWESSLAARLDPLFNRLVGKMDAAVRRDLLPSDPVAPQTPIPSDLIGWEPKGLLFDQFRGDKLRRSALGLKGGCGITLAPKLSRSSNALLAGMIYQELSAPGYWYRAKLSCPDFHLVGAFVPGVPVALSGSNKRMSWVSVPCPVDDLDLYIEYIDSDNASRYFRGEGWRKIEQKREKFTVKGGSKLEKILMRTDTGPVVSDVENGRAISMKWAGQDGTGLFKSMFEVNRASNENDLASALAALKTPALQVVWADTQGNIGIQLAGKVPIRHHDSNGIIALPAWTGIHSWQGYVPYAEMPSTKNPETGYLVAADGRPGGQDYPYLFSCYWFNDPRQVRISELLGNASELDPQGVTRLLGDVYSHSASKFTPVILKEIDEQDNYNRQEKAAAQLLREWDFLMTKESSAAAIFALFYQNLGEAVLAHSVGRDVYAQLCRYPDLVSFLIKRQLLDLDQDKADARAVRGLIANSFRAAVGQGQRLLGDVPPKWKWGDLHKINFHHPLAVRSSFLEALFDVGPIAEGGSGDSIRMAAWCPTGSFRTLSGVTLKQVAEMSSAPTVMTSVPLGNSGHFFSSNYKNELMDWINGRSIRDKVTVGEDAPNVSQSIIFRPAAAQRPADD